MTKQTTYLGDWLISWINNNQHLFYGLVKGKTIWRADDLLGFLDGDNSDLLDQEITFETKNGCTCLVLPDSGITMFRLVRGKWDDMFFTKAV